MVAIKTKKIIFTTMCGPLLYTTVWAWRWQARRKIEKQEFIDQRILKLKEAPVFVKDPSTDIPIKTMDPKEFAKEWLYKPIKMKGLFDHDKEKLVVRPVAGNQSFEVVTPLFTSVDEKTGNLNGIMVNRGRLPIEYKDLKLHLTPPNEEVEVTGVLFKSEEPLVGKSKKYKYVKLDEDTPIQINVSEFIRESPLDHLPEDDVSRKLYLKVVDLRYQSEHSYQDQVQLPKQHTPQDLCNFYVTPSRHQAYSNFWLFASCLNVGANIFIWFYI